MSLNFGLLIPVSTPGLISTVSKVFCRRKELKDWPRLYLGVSRKAGLRRFTAAPENLSPLLSSKLLCLCVTLRLSRLLHHQQPLMATFFDTPFLPRICLQSVQSVPHRASISPYWVMYANWICKKIEPTFAGLSSVLKVFNSSTSPSFYAFWLCIYSRLSYVFTLLQERRLCSFIASTLVETVTEEKPEVLQILLRMWQVL